MSDEGMEAAAPAEGVGAPPPEAVGVGIATPPEYASTTPLGQVYGALRGLFVSLDSLTPGDGSAGAGISFARDKQTLEAALATALAAIQQIDQQSTTYTQQLVDYGNTLRTQLQTLQVQCGAQTMTSTPAPTTPAPGTFTPQATGLIALGAALVGGMIGFGSARVTAGPTHAKEEE